ncbi:hypothetical protein LAZ67_7003251 [Cordylochernes scorpioides]|uniref:RNA-directed DNA polymerase n=1 Tax=Cordylochernes scorpioides TaxID=51811 RepID=A0ABY6KRY8_9ARAC|nr:hypothetical protein LAZ67_7003251 [Cordylochernes scorpioides]
MDQRTCIKFYEKINEVKKMILANRRITVREVAEDLNISIGSCHSIFINNLGMRRVAAKFVPKLLNCDQKQHRMNIANEMLDSVRDDPNLLQRVITGDEAWVYGYDVETKAQSSQWKLPHEPRPKKARQVWSNVKVLLTVFFDCRGVVHHEFLPQGRKKRPDLWKNKNWLLHHDNAPAHTSLLVRDLLAKNNTLMMPQPPYSPDLAPCDFFLFPKLKRPMKGRRYATLDEIKRASKEELKKILKNDFLKCFEDWKNRWHKCIISHGDYFEGDKIDAITVTSINASLHLHENYGEFCGRHSNLSFQSSTNIMKITMKTDSSVTSAGFIANYTITDYEIRIHCRMQFFSNVSSWFLRQLHVHVPRMKSSVLTVNVSLHKISVMESMIVWITGMKIAYNASAFVIKTGSTTQWQADFVPKEMAASDMRNRHHVQPLLTWSTNAAHSVSLESLQGRAPWNKTGAEDILLRGQRFLEVQLMEGRSKDISLIVTLLQLISKNLDAFPANSNYAMALAASKLEVEISMALLRKDETLNEGNGLALNILALKAICSDPQDFHGINLIDRLASTDLFDPNPLISLALCVADVELSENHTDNLKQFAIKNPPENIYDLDLYPESSEASFAKYFAMKLTGQANLETYYREKTAMGLQLGLPQEVILETLTEGLPFSDQRLVRVVPPENLGEWFRLVHGMHLFRRPTVSSAARGTGTANADIDQSRRPTKKNGQCNKSHQTDTKAFGQCKQSQNNQSRVPSNQVKPETPQPSRLFETEVGSLTQLTVKLFLAPNIPCPFLIDTGASLNIVPYNLYNMLETYLPNLTLKGHSLDFQTLNGFAKTMGKLSIPLTIGQISRREYFHVVNAPLPFGILSINSLHKFRLAIDFNKCTIFQLGAPLSTPSYHFKHVPNVCTYWQCQAMSQRIYPASQPSAYDNHCNKFNVPCLRIPPVKIPTNSEKIITIRPYRVPICDQQEIRNQVQQMLENGIIEQSFSPFSSPVTLVTKRDKTKRFCIDYRKVNELISSDVHPLPRIEDILDRLAQAKYFSTADISSAYWQVPIHPDSRPLLAFATLEGLYQPTRLPFGLKTSPQVYERAISQVLQRHGLDCVAHYFDDFIIYSNTLEEHQNHLRQFFAFCEAEKLQLNFAKCEFFKQSIDFLGYTITAGTTTPLTRNTDIIHAIKQPHNRKTLQSFLGAVNVYNKFIPEYARLRAPLNNLLKKDVVWIWDEACQKAFIDLKGNLTQHPILHLYKESLPCQVYCDASTLGIAGILKQVHPDGNVYPVQYFSRTLRPHEKNYSISELECLAIVESVEKFRIYLMGRKFTIFSDHHALQWLKTIKNPSGRLFRWCLRLSSYEYEVRYIKGKQQYEADLLSRNPFCGFLDATLIKTHQPPPSRESSLTIDRNGLHTVSRKGITKIIIPKPLIQQLLQTVHTQYNHPGISQMSRLISTQYYWQGMSKDIKQKVKTCPTCQLTKRPLGTTYGELSQPPEAKEPFDLLSLDTIAGFAKYGNTKIYLHVVVDHFSRYAWTFPSKSTSITTYQQVLKRVLQDGSPKRFLTDRAPAFTSPKFSSFLLNRNIHPLLTTSNNPQANGLCFPPVYLMFGTLPSEISNHSTPYPDIDKARKIAHTRTQNKHLQDKNIYDQRHKQPHFEVGDLVLVKLYHHPNTGKLAPYFTGPHTVLEIISPNVVHIDRPNQPLQRDTDTIHVNKLKLYTETVRYISPPAVSICHIKHKPDYTFPFKHLTPELFPADPLRFKPTNSEPFRHFDPAIFATRRFAPFFPDIENGEPDHHSNPIILSQKSYTPLPNDNKQCEIERPTMNKVRTNISESPFTTIWKNMYRYPIFHLIFILCLLVLPYKYMKATAVLALVCAHRRGQNILDMNLTTVASELAELQDPDTGSFGSVQSSALVGQALLSLKSDPKVNWSFFKLIEFFKNNKSDDIIFGDLVAASLALPAFLGRSYLDLMDSACPEVSMLRRTPGNEDVLKVTYSIWIGEDKQSIYTLKYRISAPHNTTFFDLFKMASNDNENYRATWKVLPWGPTVFSINNISNQPQTQTYWRLFILKDEDVLRRLHQRLDQSCWYGSRTAALHTQDRGHCDCCDRDVWRHLRLFIGHDNNNR